MVNEDRSISQRHRENIREDIDEAISDPSIIEKLLDQKLELWLKKKYTCAIYEGVIEIDGVAQEEPMWFTYYDLSAFHKTHHKMVYRHLKSPVNSSLLIVDDSGIPHKLQLNTDRNSPQKFSGFLRENLKSYFSEKELLEGLVLTSRTSIQDGGYISSSNEDREMLKETLEG
ncbi:MAG: hypothetical protein ACXABI_05155 [Candidatus Hodarchaeales archaeon]|jgi:hypothetical protein